MPCVPLFTGTTDTASVRWPGLVPMTSAFIPMDLSARIVRRASDVSPGTRTLTGHSPASLARRAVDASHPSRPRESTTAAATLESATVVILTSTPETAVPGARLDVDESFLSSARSPVRQPSTVRSASPRQANERGLGARARRRVIGLTSRRGGDAVNGAGGVVGDEQRSILVHQDVDRAAPATAVRALPPGNEIFVRNRLPIADAHPHELRSRRRRPVPRPVERDDRVTTPVWRKHRRP